MRLNLGAGSYGFGLSPASPPWLSRPKFKWYQTCLRRLPNNFLRGFPIAAPQTSRLRERGRRMSERTTNDVAPHPPHRNGIDARTRRALREREEVPRLHLQITRLLRMPPSQTTAPRPHRRPRIAPFPSWPIVTPRYIYIPADAANFPVVVDDCHTNGNNCSDDQLCDYWGVSCPVYAPIDAPAAPPLQP